MKLSDIYENAPILKQDVLPIGDKFVIKFRQLMFPAEVKDRHPIFQKPYLLIHQMDNHVPNDEFWAKAEIDRSPIFTLLLFRNFKFRLVPEIENHPEMLQHRGKHFELVDIAGDRWVLSWKNKEFDCHPRQLFIVS